MEHIAEELMEQLETADAFSFTVSGYTINIAESVVVS